MVILQYLLDIDSISNWIEAGSAFGALVLAFVVWGQGRKINTLTDVVESFRNHTDASNKLLSFEIKTRIKDAQPVFTPFKLIEVLNPLQTEKFPFKLTLKNRGQKARHVKVSPLENITDVFVLYPKISTVIQDQTLEFVFGLINNGDKYKIELSYTDEFGREYKQEVISRPKGGYHTTFPVEVIEKD